MVLKLLKLNANDAMSNGATVTSSSGSLMSRNTAHGFAPSTVAASWMSSGIDWSAPMQTRNMYGNPSQRFTMSTDTLAMSGSVSQGTSAPPRSTWLMNPKLSFIMPAQTSAPRNDGIAYGRIISTR